MEALAALRRLLERYVPLDDVEWRRIAELLRPRRLARGAHLVRAGGTVRTLSFVVAGVLRRYYVVEDREVTTGFLSEGSLATDYPGLCSAEPSESSVQALTPVHLLSIEAAGLEWLARGNDTWLQFAPRAGVALARRREHRQVELLTRSPEERYRAFLRECPDLLDRVPHYYVASYLGIAPESLSRLRRRIGARAPDAARRPQ